jgi:hypothetical protein
VSGDMAEILIDIVVVSGISNRSAAGTTPNHPGPRILVISTTGINL